MIQLARRGGWSAALLLAAGLAGCASPGLPKPPTLNLPNPVTDLQATRVQDTVTLQFTAPTKSTDKLPIQGPMVAGLCRQESAGTCREVQRQSVQAGKEITLADTLPAALTTGPPVLLTYTVTLYNSKGRTRGASGAAYAAGGAGPARVMELTAAASPGGAMLRWRPEPGTDAVELERRVKTQPGAGAPAAKTTSAGNPFAPKRAPEEVRLRAGERDAGGTVDAEAQFGQSYTYVAWRVRRLTLAGHVVEVSSAGTPMVTVEMKDTFPPAIPQGLTGAPVNGGVDLSWEPDTELDLAGYFVYRVTAGAGGGPVRLNATPVAAPGFHDGSASAGAQYRYSVSAVDQSGNESGRSAEVEESIQ